MASIVKRGDGWRAYIRIRVNGRSLSDSATKRTKREASAWASVREAEMRTQAELPPAVRFTLADLFLKYADEVSPTKGGGRWEVIRLHALAVDPNLPVSQPLIECTTEALGIWRDARLSGKGYDKPVKAGTVLREFSLLGPVFEYARRELKWLQVNPVRDVRKPRADDHRDVVYTWRKIKPILKKLGYSPRKPPVTDSQVIAVCWLVSLRTGMRSKELCGLEWSRVFGRYLELPKTKTTPREVPFSLKTMLLIRKMEGYHPEKVFNLNAGTRDTLFRRARDAAGVGDYRFHDSRHTAATWVVRHSQSKANDKVDVLTLCKIFGWSDPKQAMVYYNPDSDTVAKLLD